MLNRKKYRFKDPKPWKHQVRAVKKLLLLRGGALLMPMRSGKSRVAVDFACAAELKWKIDRVIVICPKSVKGVWRDQIRRYAPETSELKWYVTNYDRVYDRLYDGRDWEAVEREALHTFAEGGKTLLIVDEAHRLGDPGTLQSKETFKLRRKCFLCVTLTGTAWHRKPLLIFGHYKVLDDSIFGTSYKAFKKIYVTYGGYENYKVVAYNNLEEMRRKVAQKAFILKEVPSRPPVHEIIPVRLEESLDTYAAMASEAIVELKSGEYATGEIVLTKVLRLSQICGGWIRDEDGRWHRVGEEKKRAFEDWIKDVDVPKLVVAARFKKELADVCRVLRAEGWNVYLLWGGVSEPKREQRIAAFDEDEGPAAFVTQIATGALGIDLSSSDTLVYYTEDRSLVNYDQVGARIKKWKEKRALSYYHFLCQGTVDEVNHLALAEGRELAEILEKHPDYLYRG